MNQDKIERRRAHNTLIFREINGRKYRTEYGLRMAGKFWRTFYNVWRDMDSQEDERLNGGFRRFNHRIRSFTHGRDYKHWFRTLRKGQVVSACYDGKRGRAVNAVVVKSRKGVVVAEFVRWGRNSLTRVRFVEGGGWDTDGDYMPALGVSQRGDFYQLIPWIEPNPNSGSAAVVRMAVEITAQK